MRKSGKWMDNGDKEKQQEKRITWKEEKRRKGKEIKDKVREMNNKKDK